MLKTPRKFIGLWLVGLLAALALVGCGDATNTPGSAATTAALTTAPAATTAVMTSAPAGTTAVVTSAPAATTATSVTTAATSGTTAATSTTAAVGTTSAAGASSKAVACDKPAASASNGKTYLIGISVQNTIPALQNAIDGFKKGMEQCGFVEGKNVKYDLGNAQGDIPSLNAIGKKFADEKVNLLVPVGTAALINMYNTNKDNSTPIVFNSVTSPYAALPDVIKSDTNHSFVTGVQTFPPVEDGLKLLQQIAPRAKNIGILYNPTETNAVLQVKEAQAKAGGLGLTIVPQTIQNSGEVQTAALALADKVDAFLTVTDVTVVNALDSLVKVASDSKKPLFGLDPTSAPRGVVASVGFDYYDNGVLSAKLTAQVLDGAKPNDIKIEIQPKGPLAINTKAAELMGVTIPDAILSQATVKYSDITQKK